MMIMGHDVRVGDVWKLKYGEHVLVLKLHPDTIRPCADVIHIDHRYGTNGDFVLYFDGLASHYTLVARA